MSSEDQNPRVQPLREVFPDAEGVFGASYLPVGKALENAIFVLDTNTLLLPFDTGPKSLQEIEAAYKKFAKEGRLVVPGQVAREFARNRPNKISELYQNVSRRRNFQQQATGKPSALLDAIGSYQKVKDLEVQIRELHREYFNAVKDVMRDIENWAWNDPVSDVYNRIFEAGVVFDPEFEDQYLRKRWEYGVFHKALPGYKDQSKDYNAMGDMVIWETILKVGEHYKKPVVFVSGEQKSDWVLRSDNRVLFPNFELVDEFRRASGGQTFHIVSFSDFLEFGGADAEAVGEIKTRESHIVVDEKKISARSASVLKSLAAEQAVFEWLQGYCVYQDVTLDEDRFWDITVEEPGGARVGVYVTYVALLQFLWVEEEPDPARRAA